MNAFASSPYFALTHATLMTGAEEIPDATVLVQEGRILKAGEGVAVPPGWPTLPLDGDVLAPGFIDVQVNGGGGVLFNDVPTPAGLAAIAAAHRRFGTTGFLPTFISDRPEVQREALAAVTAAQKTGPEFVPELLGIHCEGPHISPRRTGIHVADLVRAMTEEDLALLMAPRPGVTLVTLAPEEVPEALISRLAAAPGVVVSAGHTMADYPAMKAGFAAGIRGVTHLYNVMPTLVSREPGALGAALTSDEIWCSLIVDGKHVHDAMAVLAWRAKPAGKLILITDAMPPVGTSLDHYRLLGQDIFVRGGICLNGEGRLAGSALSMAEAVRRAVRALGIPLSEALRMASTYPAAFLRLDNRLGTLAPGFAATMVRLNASLQVVESWVEGVGSPGEAGGL